MQLPRGRFERFVRGVTVGDVFRELGEKKFTGCCSGIFGEVQGELVFREGEVILAESQSNSGKNVILEILSTPGESVTVELSVYNESQIKLSKEFNQGFLISSEDYNAAFSQDVGTKSAENEESASKSPADKTKDSAGVLPDENTLCEEKEEEEFVLSINESEIESINRDFNKSARELLKRIHLDHLIEKNQEIEKNEH